MKTYRVFLTRAYIAAQGYDVLAANPEQAGSKALQAVREKRPDVRAEAVDKGWEAAVVAGIREIGAGLPGITVPVQPVAPDVFERGE